MREQLFACEPTSLIAYLERLENATEAEIKLAGQMFGETDEHDPIDDIYEEENGEARITIEGPLSMAGPSPLARLFGIMGTSYRDIIGACKRAAESSVERVAFAINSPGGEVAGADIAWQAISLCSKNKKTRAENNGMMASAAYWLASACPTIKAMSPACEQGSIGVKIVAIDDSGMRDAIGIKKVTIVSKNAPKKDDDVSKKSGRDSLQERVDAMEAVFIERIAEGRHTTVEDVAENYGQGAVLISSEAKRVGMIDSVQMHASAPAADNFSRQTAGVTGVLVAQTETPASAGTKEKPMTLKELLASDPAARAEYDAALKAQFDAGKAQVETRIASAKPFLALQVTKEGYDAAEVAQIGKAAIDVIAGTEDPGALRGFVRMVDMQVEKRKQVSAEVETSETGETPAQKVEADALIVAKAQALKIDVVAIQAAATAAKQDPIGVLKAEIEMQECAARSRTASGVK
jgi:ClpP class serine protease